jgi:hypothetical protein
MRTVRDAEFIANYGTDRDLKSFDLIEHQESKLPIKVIEAKDVVKGRPRPQCTGHPRARRICKRQPVPFQAKVAREPQSSFSFKGIRDEHAYVLKARYLILD